MNLIFIQFILINKIMISSSRATIRQNLSHILDKIKTAANNSPFKQNVFLILVYQVQLVAVSKTKSVELIQEAYDEGQRHFGENYVQELEDKIPKLPKDIKWHFIGKLQSNKVNKVVCPQLYCIETIDSCKLAKKVDNNCATKEIDGLNVYVQVKTSEEDAKGGVEGEEMLELIRFILEDCKNLKLKGIMTIGYAGDPKAFDVIFSLFKYLEII